MATGCAKSCDGARRARELEEVLTPAEGVGKDGFLEEEVCK